MTATTSFGDYGAPLGVECAWRPAAEPARRSLRNWLRPIALLALAFGLWHGGQAAYIKAKAELAQVLMQRSWQRTLAGAGPTKPWAWADTWPVARLIVAGHDVDLFVLAGADGRALAFGPGHVYGTPAPGTPGNSVIGGHRDTHLHFLKDVRIGEEFRVQRPDGHWLAYRVTQTRVTDKDDLSPLDQDGPTRLTLVTCWPFGALRAGGPQRYVVTAVATSHG
jgi:sortase A